MNPSNRFLLSTTMTIRSDEEMLCHYILHDLRLPAILQSYLYKFIHESNVYSALATLRDLSLAPQLRWEARAKERALLIQQQLQQEQQSNGRASINTASASLPPATHVAADLCHRDRVRSLIYDRYITGLLPEQLDQILNNPTSTQLSFTPFQIRTLQLKALEPTMRIMPAQVLGPLCALLDRRYEYPFTIALKRASRILKLIADVWKCQTNTACRIFGKYSELLVSPDEDRDARIEEDIESGAAIENQTITFVSKDQARVAMSSSKYNEVLLAVESAAEEMNTGNLGNSGAPNPSFMPRGNWMLASPSSDRMPFLTFFASHPTGVSALALLQIDFLVHVQSLRVLVANTFSSMTEEFSGTLVSGDGQQQQAAVHLQLTDTLAQCFDFPAPVPALEEINLLSPTDDRGPNHQLPLTFTAYEKLGVFAAAIVRQVNMNDTQVGINACSHLEIIGTLLRHSSSLCGQVIFVGIESNEDDIKHYATHVVGDFTTEAATQYGSHYNVTVAQQLIIGSSGPSPLTAWYGLIQDLLRLIQFCYFPNVPSMYTTVGINDNNGNERNKVISVDQETFQRFLAAALFVCPRRSMALIGGNENGQPDPRQFHQHPSADSQPTRGDSVTNPTQSHLLINVLSEGLSMACALASSALPILLMTCKGKNTLATSPSELGGIIGHLGPVSAYCLQLIADRYMSSLDHFFGHAATSDSYSTAGVAAQFESVVSAPVPLCATFSHLFLELPKFVELVIVKGIQAVEERWPGGIGNGLAKKAAAIAAMKAEDNLIFDENDETEAFNFHEFGIPVEYTRLVSLLRQVFSLVIEMARQLEVWCKRRAAAGHGPSTVDWAGGEVLSVSIAMSGRKGYVDAEGKWWNAIPPSWSEVNSHTGEVVPTIPHDVASAVDGSGQTVPWVPLLFPEPSAINESILGTHAPNNNPFYPQAPLRTNNMSHENARMETPMTPLERSASVTSRVVPVSITTEHVTVLMNAIGSFSEYLGQLNYIPVAGATAALGQLLMQQSQLTLASVQNL
eukprot:GILI01016049.1.p1 GENE.GILI01016049.1~~GILI01016049.1.p1  ORF type:complete len:1103 (+),score=187.37 GILI01016049.1:249-3311(+)